ncbi:SAM-dependent methyltransferase [Bradyrhizobium sp. 6(2017)]|uniref:SAM-dependent methyltransferase n=1 Tax=Bradyrhizobium sp. 6(2017) TaxID=1197460 RepID=UPI002FE6857B
MRLDKNDHLLERGLAVGDQWQLDSNPLEQEPYAQMFRMSRSNGEVARALEVAGAAFAFTEMLGPHCQRITVQDVMPQD